MTTILPIKGCEPSKKLLEFTLALATVARDAREAMTDNNKYSTSVHIIQ
jgi:hypothetical protein